MSTEPFPLRETASAGHELIDLGYHLVPCEFGTKRPLIKWKESECSHRLLDQWLARFRFRMNIAIHARNSGVVVLDADTVEAAAWIGKNCPPTPMIAATPRGGIHAYFQARDDVPDVRDLHGIPGLEVKRHLIVASPSWSEEHHRAWRWTGDLVRPETLPTIDRRLISKEPLREPGITDFAPSARRAAGTIRDVTRWIMEVESIQGQGGSNQCFKVACRLADAGFSREEAMHWLRRWNDRKAVPPWSDAELEHKLLDAFNR